MENYVTEIYSWAPKGLLFVLSYFLAKALLQKVYDGIMTALDELKKGMATINSKMEVFDSKITDINIKINSSVTIDRYMAESERIWKEIHHIKERNAMLEHIVKLERKLEQDQ